MTTQMCREDLKRVTAEINQLITKNLFTTITNANFDPEMTTSQIEKTLQIKSAFLQLKSWKIARGRLDGLQPFSLNLLKAATVGVLSARMKISVHCVN